MWRELFNETCGRRNIIFIALLLMMGCAGPGLTYPYPVYPDKSRPLSDTSVISVFYSNPVDGIQDTNIFEIDGVKPAIGGYGHWARVVPGNHQIVIAYSFTPQFAGSNIQMTANFHTINIDMKARRTYVVEPDMKFGKIQIRVKELPEGFVYVKPGAAKKVYKAEY